MTTALDVHRAQAIAVPVGRLLAVIALLAVGLPIGWRVLQVSEARAMEATRENLSLGLAARAAEQVAAAGRIDSGWLDADPFSQLRWRQENYCGELADGRLARRGCWHYLPQRNWVLYRSRFSGLAETDGGLHAFVLQPVPDQATTGKRSRGGFVSLELKPVPARELAAWMTPTEEQATR
ncbi:hypothetical protein JQR85_04890 [Stutzerimonas urumqiensis]|uniref:hypothetical protein n=1 Tax=Stutzerimonas urumqiensis TaxID=638269 RepID=UPI003DA21103